MKALLGLLGEFQRSLTWRLFRPLIRLFLGPRSLGRGHTALDDISARLASTGDSMAALQYAAGASVVYRESSEHFFARRYGISVLVTTRNGAEMLERLFTSFDRHHSADAAEFIVVDHGSADASLEVVRHWMKRLPIKWVGCASNQPYALANNLARTFARGEFLVFLNNDIEFTMPVLEPIRAQLQDPAVGMVGLPLYYPQTPGVPDRQLQHAGIRFRYDHDAGFFRPYNVQELDGGNAHDGAVDARAVTGALAACRAVDFDAVGGFDEGYDYGFEDVDLCLSLTRQLGRINRLLVGVSAIHREFGTQSSDDCDRVARRREANADWLVARHGRYLAEESMRERLDEPNGGRACADLSEEVRFFREPAELLDQIDRRWTGIRVALIRRGEARHWLAEAGLLDDVDLAVTMDEADRAALENETHAVQALADATLAQDPYPERSAWLGDQVQALLARPGFVVRVAVPERADAREWGDYHFAAALCRAMRDEGYRARIEVQSEWGRRRLLPDDLSLALPGLAACPPSPGMINLAWLISHPEAVDDDTLEQYDHVFVASSRYAMGLASRLRVPVSVLLQCTDPARFPYRPPPGKPTRLLFVGNSRGVYRPIVKAAVDEGLDPEVYGTWWAEFIGEDRVRGEHVDNRDLGRLYAECGVVLNDHWEDMRQYGFLSNRLFDVAATGACLVTDDVAGLDDVLTGPTVRVYTEGADLASLVAGFPVSQTDARRLSERVLAQHTFHQRAREIDRAGRSLGLAHPRSLSDA